MSSTAAAAEATAAEATAEATVRAMLVAGGAAGPQLNNHNDGELWWNYSLFNAGAESG